MHNDSASTRMHACNGASARHFLSSRSMHRQADYHLSRRRFKFARGEAVACLIRSAFLIALKRF